MYKKSRIKEIKPPATPPASALWNDLLMAATARAARRWRCERPESGNHDVCWNTSFSAMRRVPDAEYPADLRAALDEPDSNYRWSWKERALYIIEDFDAYKRRMNYYWDFVEGFYAGVPLLKPIDRSRGYQLHQDARWQDQNFDSYLDEFFTFIAGA